MRARLQQAVKRLFVPPARARRRGQGVANGIELVGPIVVFTVLGYWIDGLIGTRPLFTVVLFLFAASGTFIAAYYRYRAQSEAFDEGKPWSRAAAGSAQRRAVGER